MGRCYIKHYLFIANQPRKREQQRVLFLLIMFRFMVPFAALHVQLALTQCNVSFIDECILQGNNVRYIDCKNQTDFACVAFAVCVCMLPRRKAKVNLKSVDGAFPKPRRLHLGKG